MKLPNLLHKYFWDIDVKHFNPEEKPIYVIARLLDRGDVEAVKWVRKTFGKEKIVETLKNYRDMSLKSASFWGLIYKVPRSEIKCFQTPFLEARKMLWKY